MAYSPGSKVKYKDEFGEEHIATIESIEGPKHVLSYTDGDTGVKMNRTIYGTEKISPVSDEEIASTDVNDSSEQLHEGQKEGRRLSVKLTKRLSLKERKEIERKNRGKNEKFRVKNAI